MLANKPASLEGMPHNDAGSREVRLFLELGPVVAGSWQCTSGCIIVLVTGCSRPK